MSKPTKRDIGKRFIFKGYDGLDYAAKCIDVRNKIAVIQYMIRGKNEPVTAYVADILRLDRINIG